jgi:hypothetical protein
VPQHITLTELTAQEAAAHATKVIFDVSLYSLWKKESVLTFPITQIALQTQSRGNHINAEPNPPRPSSPSPIVQSSVLPRAAPSTKKQEDEIKALKVELANEKKRHKSPSEPTLSELSSPFQVPSTHTTHDPGRTSSSASSERCLPGEPKQKGSEIPSTGV